MTIKIQTYLHQETLQSNKGEIRLGKGEGGVKLMYSEISLGQYYAMTAFLGGSLVKTNRTTCQVS